MKRIIFAALVASAPAVAQELSIGATRILDGVIFSYSNDPATARFDWPKVKACAVERFRFPKPDESGGNDMTSPVWRQYELDYHRISACRLALLARHEGWKAATSEPDPIPPELMMPEMGH